MHVAYILHLNRVDPPVCYYIYIYIYIYIVYCIIFYNVLLLAYFLNFGRKKN
jgi:hypothetical protein